MPSHLPLARLLQSNISPHITGTSLLLCWLQAHGRLDDFVATVMLGAYNHFGKARAVSPRQRSQGIHTAATPCRSICCPADVPFFVQPAWLRRGRMHMAWTVMGFMCCKSQIMELLIPTSFIVPLQVLEAEALADRMCDAGIVNNERAYM